MLLFKHVQVLKHYILMPVTFFVLIQKDKQDTLGPSATVADGLDIRCHDIMS